MKVIVSRIEREKEEAMLTDMPVWIHNALILLGHKFYWD